MARGVHDADLLDFAFWAEHVRGHARNTVRTRLDFLHRLSEFVGIPLRDVEPHHLLKFERVAIAGKAPESRRSYTCHIRSFYRWAKATGIVQYDPSEVLTIPQVPQHLPRPIGEDYLAVALAAARPKMRAMLTLAAYAGLRCCEIAALQFQDICREEDGTTYVRVQGKGAKERRVEIGQTVIEALQAHGMKRRGPVFIGQDGRQMGAKSVSASGNRFLELNGIPATMHQLRHRYGSISYQLSHDLRLIQDMLGHASPQTTAGYVQTSADASAKLVRALDAHAARRQLPTPRGTGRAPAGPTG